MRSSYCSNYRLSKNSSQCSASDQSFQIRSMDLGVFSTDSPENDDANIKKIAQDVFAKRAYVCSHPLERTFWRNLVF